MKHIKEAERIHETPTRFLPPTPKKKPSEEREENRIYSPPSMAAASPAQLRRCPGPAWPIRMICLLSFHHPPRDNTAGRERDVQNIWKCSAESPPWKPTTSYAVGHNGCLFLRPPPVSEWKSREDGPTGGGEAAQSSRTSNIIVIINIYNI